MKEQIIKLSDNAAIRIKEIMSKAENLPIGVRIGVKSGGCAGMSYVMEYAKDIKENEEIIEDKGVKVLIDPKAIMYFLVQKWIIKKKTFLLNLSLRTLMKLKDVDVVNLLRFNHYNTSQIQLDEAYVQNYKFLEILILYKHLFDRQ